MRKINMKFIDSYFIRIAIALVVSIVLFIITGATCGFLITSILMSAYFLRPKGDILGAGISRIFIATIVILTVYQVEAVVFWLLHLTVNPSIYVTLTALIVFVLNIYLRRSNKTLGLSLSFSKIDILLLIPALLIGGLYVGRVTLPSESDTVSIVRSITLANDDVSHFAMVDALIRNSSNLLIDSPTKMALPSHATYPMGWHVSTTVAATSFFPEIGSISTSQMTIVYFLLKVATFMGVVFSITLFMYQLSSILRQKITSIWIVLPIYFGVAFSTFLIVMPQMFEGFFSFLPVLIYLALFTMIAIDIQTKTTRNQLLDIALISFLVGSSLSWVLTGPMLAISYLLLKIQSAGSFKKLTTSTYVGLGIFVVTFLFQIWTITHASKSSVSTLASQGGITTPDFALIALLTGLFLFLLTKKRYSAIMQGILYSILPLYILVAAVISYISLSSPQLSYYYYKLEIVLLFVLLPLGVVAFIDFVNKVTSLTLNKTPQINTSLIRLSMVIFIPIALIPSIIGYPYFENNVSRSIHYNLSHEDAVKVIGILDNKFGQATTVSYFFVQGSPPRSIVASNLARTGQHNTQCVSQIYNAIYSGDIKNIGSSTTQCAPVLPTIIIHTDSETKQALRDVIPASLLSANEVILESDL